METTKEIVQMLLEFLERVGGIALSEGFRIAVKFVVNEGIAKLGLGVIVLLLSIALLVFAIKLFKRAYEHESEDSMAGAATLMVFSILFFLASLVLFYNGYMRVSAPEWFAVKNLINLVK